MMNHLLWNSKSVLLSSHFWKIIYLFCSKRICGKKDNFYFIFWPRIKILLCILILASSPYLEIKFMFHRVLWYLLKLFCLYLKVIFTCLYYYFEFISHLISCMSTILGKNNRNKVIYFSISFPRGVGSSEFRLQ